MAMTKEKIEQYGNELYEALKGNYSIEPISNREPDSTIEDAYAIQHHFLKRRMDDDKSKIIGKKNWSYFKSCNGYARCSST